MCYSADLYRIRMGRSSCDYPLRKYQEVINLRCNQLSPNHVIETQITPSVMASLQVLFPAHLYCCKTSNYEITKQ